MYHHRTTLCRFLLIGMTAFILMGCGAKGRPSEFKQTADEMKEGPGLLTGKEGEFAVYDSKKGGPFWKQSQEQSMEASKETGKEASATPVQSSGTAPIAAEKTPQGAQVTAEEAKAFQKFQEWKQEQKEFREFQEWKKTSQGAAEYKEFLEWQEWKAYQEWKKQQGQ
jgi:hypothetical protein